jgi:hypothetical protein
MATKGDDSFSKPARTLAYQPPPSIASDPIALVGRYEELTLVARMRQIARLETRHLEPAEIAVELSKGGVEWPLEVVLRLMGIDSTQDAEPRQMLRDKYIRVRSEVESPEIVNPERNLQEMRALAIQVLSEALVSAELPKDKCDVAIKVLNMAGIAAARTQEIVEIRFDAESLAAMRSILEGYRPEVSKLDELIEEELGPPKIN